MIFDLLSREIIHSNKWYSVFLDKIKNKNTKGKYEYYTIDFKCNSVSVVVCNKHNEILFVNTYRYPSNQISLEIPAGSIEKDENLFEAAYRECLEETGYSIIYR